MNKFPGIGRANSARTWLSMWSLETQSARAAPSWLRSTCRRWWCRAPATWASSPSDARGVFEALASADKTLELIPGAHYFEDSEVGREAMVEMISGWVTARS